MNVESTGLIFLVYQYQVVAFLVYLLIVCAIGLLFYGIYWLIIRKTGLSIRTRIHRLLTFIGVGIVVVLFTMVTFTLITEHQVNKKLGFNYATPETPMGEPFLITKVVDGKAMHLAGLRKGDVIRFGSTRDLYKLLIDHQGKEITIPIARNGKEIDINLKVPEIRLMVVKFSFL